MAKRSIAAARRWRNRWQWKYKRHVFHPVDWGNADFWLKQAQRMAARQSADLRYHGRGDRRRKWRLAVSKTRVHFNRYLRLKGLEQ